MTEEEGENWEVYPGFVEDEFAMFAVNIGPRADAPFDNLRWLNVVRIPFDAQPGGMPDADTNAFLYELEDALSSRASTRGTVQVGRLTVAGRRELFFYAATDETELLRRDMHDEFGDEVECDAIASLDASWRVYLEFLYPQPLDFQRIHNQKVLRLLQEHGDNVAIPRQIDHFAYFPTAEARDTFVSGIRADGMQIGEQADAAEGELPFGVGFSSHGPVDLASIDRVTTDLFVRITDLGGNYDGWGCPVQSNGSNEEE